MAENATGGSPTADVVPADPWAMTPAQAGEALAERSAKFDAVQVSSAEQVQDARDAEVRLAALTADPTWVKKFHQGSPAERAEYEQLTQMIAAATGEDGTSSTWIGNVETVGEFGVKRQDLIGVINDLGKVGIPPEGVERIVTGNFSDEDVAEARHQLDRLMATKSWADGLLAGDPECLHAFRAWCGVIASRQTL
jgi:hypothetical protein